MGARAEGPAGLALEAGLLGHEEKGLEVLGHVLVVGRAAEDVPVIALEVLFVLDGHDFLELDDIAAQTHALGDIFRHDIGIAGPAVIRDEHLFHGRPPWWSVGTASHRAVMDRPACFQPTGSNDVLQGAAVQWQNVSIHTPQAKATDQTWGVRLGVLKGDHGTTRDWKESTPEMTMS